MALVPTQAYDAFLISMSALGPALKLTAIVIAMIVHGNVYLLATAYLLTGVVAVVINTSILLLILRREGPLNTSPHWAFPPHVQGAKLQTMIRCCWCS